MLIRKKSRSGHIGYRKIKWELNQYDQHDQASVIINLYVKNIVNSISTKQVIVTPNLKVEYTLHDDNRHPPMNNLLT